jgi:hypothetical protein
LHKEFNVVKNPDFINQALASKNGFFGSDTSGHNNGFYNKTFKDNSFLFYPRNKNCKRTYRPGLLVEAAKK